MKFAQKHSTLLLLAVLLFGKTYAQNTPSINFFDQIKKYNLATVLNAESFLAEDREDSKEKVKRAEILGFIGNNYQRFYIHFVSITKNPENPYEYLAYGKTRVKDNICSFKGTIKIKQARMYTVSELPAYKQGYTVCDVVLYEDKNQNASGLIKGKLTSNFLIDNKGVFRYDALMFVADGFSNNQFVGSWTSYKTKVAKKCNWGDYRIPESGNLDIGAGEFSVDEKYLKNGWESYQLAWSTSPETAAVKKAKQKENERWWK